MYFNKYDEEEKREICKQLKNYSLEECVKDLMKLKTGVSEDITKIKPLSLVGNKFVEHFTLCELLNTRCKQGISFYDFWCHREFYLNRDKSTLKLIEYIQREKPLLDEITRAKKVFNIYYGSVNVFRPANACRLYARYSPKCVLDFTMGWGGRMVGAFCSNVTKYIGIDNNMRLKPELISMLDTLKQTGTSVGTDYTLLFEDCLGVDYSQFEYDMVFTSPPYYNKEIYGETTATRSVLKTEEEWDATFYIPIIKKTWKHLSSKNGNAVYCLNIPQPLYEKVCVPILGEAVEQIELNKFSRTAPNRETDRKNLGQKYKEYIYVWIKK